MAGTVHLLLVEDSAGDARLMREMLRKAPDISIEVVDRLAAAKVRLSSPGIDLVLLDLGLPDSQGLDTLAQVLAPHPALPVVVLTGLDDEDVALAAVKAGAQDYLVKGRFDEFSLRRSIRYALERQRAETALHESEERYRTLFNEMPAGVYRTSEDGRIQVANPALAALLGHDSPAELLGHDVREFYVEPEERERWRQMVEQEGILHGAEIQLRRKDGTLIWVLDNGRAVRDESGRVTHFEGTLSDITKRKRAEQKLQALSLRNEAMLGAVPDIIMEVDTKKVYAWANRAGIEFFGEGAIGKEAAFYFEGEQETYALVQPLFDGKEETFYVESWQRRQDGQKRLLGWWCRVLKDADEKVIGALSTARDLTERNRTEVELRESEERYRAMVHSASDAIISIDSAGAIVGWNPGAEGVFGYTEIEIRGQPLTLALPARHTEGHLAGMAQLRTSGQSELLGKTIESEGLRKGGSGFPIDLSLSEWQVGEEKFYTAIIRDITERKRAEQALRESEERYRELVELSPDGIGIHCEGKVVYVNPAAVRLFRANRPEDLVGLPVMQLIHPDYRAIALERVRRSYENSLPAAMLEEAIVTLDGQSVEVEISAAPIVHEGKPATQIIIRDITERKQAESALRESEERLRALFAAMTDVVIVYDADGRYLSIAPTDPSKLYRPPDEMLGKTVHEILPIETADYTVARIREAIQTSRVVTGEYALHLGGEERWFASSASRLSESTVIWVAHDITERKHAELALVRRVDEMESLYQTSMQTLARGDLHGLLTAIVESAARLTGGDRGALCLPTADGDRIRVHISYNMQRDYVGTELEMGEGISGRAAQERRAIMIENYEAWEGRSPKFQASDIGRILAIPMQVGERLIGVLNIADSNTGSYGEDDIRLASLFADQAAMAIESTRLVNETNRRASYLEALTSTAAALRAAVKPQEMYADVLDQVVDQLRAEGATLALMDPESGETEAVLAVGVWQGTTGMRLSRGQGIIGMVTSSGQAFVSDDVRGDARLARPELLQDLPAIACVPLTVEDQIVGCVMVGRREPLSAEEVQLLTGLAEIAGNAIYRAGVMATLEARVDQRTQELEAANRELEAFAYSVSHDLRAPLRAMHGFSTALLSDSQGQLDEQGRHYLDRIGAAAKHMGELIDALLDLSRIARREMRRQPVDLSVLAREVASELQTQDPPRRVEWVIPDELPAQGDAHLLSLALQNLMGNAWKFTGPRPQARIEVGALPRTSPASAPGSGKEEGGLVYFVRDNGVGFDTAYADKLFAPFQRLHGMSEFPGTGIGLATVQRIITRHGGRIWAEAEVDRGATFFFTLERA